MWVIVMLMRQSEKDFIRGFCAALTEAGCSPAQIKKACDDAGVTIRKALASDVEPMDLAKLREAGAK